MAIYEYTSATLALWLPADYADVTNWSPFDVDAALEAGYSPHTIAAVIWSEYAATLPVDDDQKVVQSWKNGDQSETYVNAKSARGHAFEQAAWHRRRAPVKAARLSAPSPRFGDT